MESIRDSLKLLLLRSIKDLTTSAEFHHCWYCVHLLICWEGLPTPNITPWGYPEPPALPRLHSWRANYQMSSFLGQFEHIWGFLKWDLVSLVETSHSWAHICSWETCNSLLLVRSVIQYFKYIFCYHFIVCNLDLTHGIECMHHCDVIWIFDALE